MARTMYPHASGHASGAVAAVSEAAPSVPWDGAAPSVPWDGAAPSVQGDGADQRRSRLPAHTTGLTAQQTGAVKQSQIIHNFNTHTTLRLGTDCRGAGGRAGGDGGGAVSKEVSQGP